MSTACFAAHWNRSGRAAAQALHKRDLSGRSGPTGSHFTCLCLAGSLGSLGVVLVASMDPRNDIISLGSLGVVCVASCCAGIFEMI